MHAAGRNLSPSHFLRATAKVFPDFPNAGLADATDGQHPGSRPHSAAQGLEQGAEGARRLLHDGF